MPEAVIVSACLLGLKTRYDGRDALSTEAVSCLRGKTAIPVCPEQLGGLPTPRPKAGVQGGGGADVIEGGAEVMDENGSAVTANFLKGAQEVLKIARLTGARAAFLKEHSPSCGVSGISWHGETTEGPGVTAALLEKEGLRLKGF